MLHKNAFSDEALFRFTSQYEAVPFHSTMKHSAYVPYDEKMKNESYVCKYSLSILKEQRETIICNQIGRAGTSIGANIHEAQYAHGKADFVSKLQIALKEANETSYWLLLLGKTNILSSAEYDRLETLCREIRITLIASINTTKQNLK